MISFSLGGQFFEILELEQSSNSEVVLFQAAVTLDFLEGGILHVTMTMVHIVIVRVIVTVRVLEAVVAACNLQWIEESEVD